MKIEARVSADACATDAHLRGLRTTRRAVLLGGAGAVVAKALPWCPGAFASTSLGDRPAVAIADPALDSWAVFSQQMRANGIPTKPANSADQVWFQTLDPLLRGMRARAVVGLTDRATFHALAVMAQDHRLATVLRVDRFRQGAQWRNRLTASAVAVRAIRASASRSPLTDKSLFDLAARAARRPFGVAEVACPLQVVPSHAATTQDLVLWVLGPLS